ncbi:hypothetical protein NP493_18g06020 [Ridgeia piscesae]|uniref:Uncharacterized protein n=1 Tax=Ridgeia piscesae TaxID=27915 RepID=A0AAD9PDX9_RIDPI|nr:hypothetical protein NP493_18g06020 [Ridgeia piscesae]
MNNLTCGLQAFQNKASHSVALHQTSRSIGCHTVLGRHHCIRHRSASDVTSHIGCHIAFGHRRQTQRYVTPSNLAHWVDVCSLPLSQDLESLSGASEDTAVYTVAQHLRRESNYLQSIVRMHSRVHAYIRTHTTCLVIASPTIAHSDFVLHELAVAVATSTLLRHRHCLENHLSSRWRSHCHGNNLLI